MNAAMVHRGPDDEGVFTDPSGIAFGARRLSVIDVEHGHQPISNEDGTVWVALNGEIYNHPRLQQLLRDRGHTLATATDTEVLAHLYEEYGVDLVHALEGMFAFAVWDSRRGQLLIARDRFGEKPLFYQEVAGRLTFASELSVLRAGIDGADELDPDVVDEYMTFGYVAGARSIISGIRQLPPGSRMVWRRGEEPRIDRYWRPPTPVEQATESVEDLTSELERLLTDSVKSRLIADVPVGVFLSGGVDSTLIAALAARESSRPIQTFTVGYDVGTVSETEAAREAAREIGSDHHELNLAADSVVDRIPAVLAALDQPLADQAFPAFHAVAELARESVTVAVGGEGADELFCGYPRYRWLERGAKLERRLPRVLATAGAGALHNLPKLGRMERLASVLERGGDIERQLHWTLGSGAGVGTSLYGPRLHRRSVPELAADLAGYSPDGPDTAARLMLLDQTHWLPGDVLAKADRASMLVSLEVRTPFLNHELAEFAATVPSQIHLANGGKNLLRRLLAEVVPDTVLKRPKTGFRVPAAHWLRGPLVPVMKDQVENGSACAEGWIDPAAANRLLDRHVSGVEDNNLDLWRFLAFGLWLDRLRGR